ncbi:MAG: pantetheine-phosphate adenylyltransferase [Lautropia mirabilis]|jgi:pantetheine-phosphate adenylyltransferase|uniref:pantetheine-phosphate adenylyltransferase n=1 Tax=Lautropia mirabilis TaxID=47671 RepID=UPI000F2D6108|nr:pantetheine-phosphate adenylyltransferase [Lautropia mirabilis]MBF1235340.1 pantetheine-phosphate adenylyltransferase [Lautropia mirabilis]MBF1247970.1 pantetheine-phosphate adenylyltransferase [Lautropia mirabilis]RKW44221.1 MAG: pantetheine-phosphate adenylyltransferase [Lautropia sp.]
MSLVVYPGTFDPLTLGHQDVVNRVAAHHESVVVAISDSRSNTLFTMAERVDMAKAILVGLPNVRVMSFSGLVTDFARDIGASLIVRGLRDASDFDYERRMASLNRILQPTIDTHFIIPDDRYQSITGTLVREIAMMGGDVRAFVNPVVLAALQEKYLKRQQEPRKESR